MGKGGGKAPKVQQSPTDIQTAAQLKDIEEGFSKPLRGLITPQILGTFANNDPISTKMPGSARDMYEQQFDVANRNIQNTAGGRGGMLRRSLVENQNQRASTLSKGMDDYRQLGIERAMGMIPSALPNAQAQMGAAQSIAGREQAANAANAQMKAQQQASKGEGIGGLVGKGGLGLLKHFFPF